MKVTIKEVAQLAGVGVGTASYALNGTGSTKVGARTRERVLAAARQLNYRVNTFGRALKMDRSYLVGAIFPTVRHESIPEIMQGMEDELTRHGYGMLFYTYSELEELRSKCRCLLDKRADGIILFPEAPHRHDYYDFYRELAASVPVVATSGHRQEELPRVLVDGYELGRIGTEYLIANGHRKIALVNDWLDWRTDGYRDVLAVHGIPFVPDYVFRDFSRPHDGPGLLSWWLEFPPEQRPTAVFCPSDGSAADLQNAAHDREIELPRELSVLGTDGLIIGTLAHPRLSSMGQPHYRQGAESVRLLLELITGSAPENVLLQPTLIPRESVWNFNRKN